MGIKSIIKKIEVEKLFGLAEIKNMTISGQKQVPLPASSGTHLNPFHQTITKTNFCIKGLTAG